MVKKLIKNFKLSLILFIIIVAFFWVAESLSSAQNFIKSSWWFWLLLPFGLRFYNWFKNLKQKAFDYGADTSGEKAERNALKKDLKEKQTENEYKKMLEQILYSKEDAKKIRSQLNEESIQIQKELGNDYTIPLHRYICGLPGSNLLRPSEIKIQFTVAKISNNNLEFYNTSPSDSENSLKLGNKFAEIPLASIQKIEIIDLLKNREIKRISSYIGQKIAQTVVNAASQTGGATVTKESVPASQLIINYLNEDGVIIPATFIFNSNSKLGLKAIENLKILNTALKNHELLGKLNWGNGTIFNIKKAANNISNTEDIFEITDVTALAGDLIVVLKWINMLSPHDSAVLTAKLSAEMIAGVLQNPSIPLIEITI